jgi:hypothetical protein
MPAIFTEPIEITIDAEFDKKLGNAASGHTRTSKKIGSPGGG